MGFSRSTPAQGDPCAGPVDQQQAAGRQPSPGPKSPSLGQRLSGAPPKPAPTRWRLRSRRRRDVGRSIDSTFGALGPRSGLHQFPAVPTRHSLHDPEFKRLLQVWPDPTNHAPPTTLRPKAPSHEPQPAPLRRGRIGRNGGQVFNLPPNVSTPGRNVSTLGRNVSTFANQVSTFPDPTVVRSASSGPLLPNPGRPSAYLFRAVGHLQLVARDIQAEKHRVGHSSTRRATLAPRPSLYRPGSRQRPWQLFGLCASVRAGTTVLTNGLARPTSLRSLPALRGPPLDPRVLQHTRGGV